MEQTFVMLKPDALNRSLIGKVVSRFEEKGLKLAALKMVKLSEKLCDEHYAHHASKSFYPRLKEFMTAYPVVCAVLEGKNAVEVVRKLCGATNSRDADPGTIRGDFGMSVQSNLIHASDSLETAYTEIERFFSEEELMDYETSFFTLQYADDEKASREKIIGRPRKTRSDQKPPKEIA